MGTQMISRRRNQKWTGAVSLMVLMAMLVGVPVALWSLRGNPLPTSLPTLGQIRTTLLEPDTNATLFLAVVTVVGWLTWLWFALGVLVEAIGMIRGVTVPSVRGLRLPRRWAAGLLGGAMLLAPATAIAAPPSAPIAVTAPQTPPQAERIATINYTVQDGNSLWQLAEVFLGNGERWHEIVQANPGLTASPEQLPVGITLSMPTNLLGAEDVYMVQPGDNLWDIAQVLLGDGSRFHEITTSSGEALTSDTINPGQQLRIPLSAAPPAPAAVVPAAPAPADPAPPAADPAPQPGAAEPAPPAVPVPGAANLPPLPQGFEAAPETTAPAAPSAPQTTPAAPTTTAAPATPDPTTIAEPAPETDTVPTAETSTDQGSLMRTIGVSTLVATGLAGLVALGRRRQQHRRRRGDDIAWPEGSAASADSAVSIAASDDEVLKKLDVALRAVADHCRNTDRDLPPLLGVSVQPDALALSIPDAEALGLPAPWMCVDGAAWSLPISARLDPPDTVLSPYPALVQLGSTEGDIPMLVNLEELGYLAITASSVADTLAVTRSLALALAVSPLAAYTTLSLVGVGREIAEAIDDTRISWSTDVDEVIARLDRQTRADCDALTDAKVGSATQARLTSIDAEIASLEIVVFGTPLNSQQQQRLTEILSRRPKVAIAAVCATAEPSAEWAFALTDTSTAALRNSDTNLTIELTPNVVAPNDYQDLIEVLATTHKPSVPTRTAPAAAAWAASDIDVRIIDADTPADLIPSIPAFTVVPPVPEDADEDNDLEEPAAAATLGDPISDRIEGASKPVREDPVPEIPHIWIHLLGTPRVTPLSGVSAEELPALKGRAGVCAELAIILITHPGIPNHMLDQLMWPHGGDKSPKQSTLRRQDVIRRLRIWLGQTASDELAFPKHFDRTGNTGYGLHESVISDWAVWQQLLPQGPVAASTAHLEVAASLVEGQPFSNVPARRFKWAEELQQRMISAVADALEELAARYIHAGDLVHAEEVARKALVVDPSREGAWRLVILSTAASDTEGTRSTITDMLAYFEQLGVDELEEETDELLANLAQHRDPTGEYPYRIGLPTSIKRRKKAVS
ncbi:LysM peptidoglycan-binding domain-containing protein [Nocardia sp. NPDC051030]|uniref:LysM peptidoglycan-binding domain-containing protein n=1 Tax=Nocardia sp. NPDC051030 TaxID=3155162 RepID=UPI003438881A